MGQLLASFPKGCEVTLGVTEDVSMSYKEGLDRRVTPLHITYFLLGLPWLPNEEDGQWSSTTPQPPTLRPLSLCPQPPAPPCSLRGKITLSQENTAPLRWREGCTKESEV